MLDEQHDQFLKQPCVDHIDNTRTNNNINNLRWATFQENNFNSCLASNNTSGFKGISFHKRDKKWEAKIRVNGKKYHLGNFDNIEEAIKARQKRAKELFGEFLNECEKPQEIEVNINIKKVKNKNIKVNVNIVNEDEDEDEELRELEREFEELLKK